jgi:hypothetical protein
MTGIRNMLSNSNTGMGGSDGTVRTSHGTHIAVPVDPDHHHKHHSSISSSAGKYCLKLIAIRGEEWVLDRVMASALDASVTQVLSCT